MTNDAGRAGVAPSLVRCTECGAELHGEVMALPGEELRCGLCWYCHQAAEAAYAADLERTSVCATRLALIRLTSVMYTLVQRHLARQ